NPDIVPGPSWSTVNLDFVPSTEWHVSTSGGALATASDFANVLGNLSGIFIRGEFSIGLVESPGLDNVTLVGAVASVPEPSSLVMMALPGVAVVMLRTRRQKREGSHAKLDQFIS